MTRSSLRPYLDLVPLFRYLPREVRCAIAGELVHKRLVGEEAVDLRGDNANVFCIVTRGRLSVHVRLDDGCVLESDLAPGQWTDESILIGWRQAKRAHLVADSGGADVLLLWSASLNAIPLYKELRTVAWLASVLWQLAPKIAKRARCRIVGTLKAFWTQMLRYPVVAGVVIALIFVAGFVVFIAPGRALLADLAYYWVVHWIRPSSEMQARQLAHILDLVPKHATTRVEIGNLAVQSNDWKSAILHYGAVASVDGAGANNLGVLLLRQGDPAAALQALTLSVQQDPNVALAYQNIGIAYQQLGHEREAVRAFKEALRIDPTLIVARYNLGMYDLSQGALLEAGIAFERILEQDLLCAPAYIGKGLVHAEIGDWEKAARAFQQAVELDPNSKIARFHLGWAFVKMGDRTEARAAFVEVLWLGASQEMLDWMGAVLTKGTVDTLEEGAMDSGP